MKASTLRSPTLLAAVAICSALACSYSMPAHASACLQLSADIGYGMTDQSSGGPIIALQDYLQSSGYLSGVPNGHFGAATLAAVKAFQTANAVSATGYVGPLTRAAINQKTCGSAVPQTQPSAPSTVPTASVVSNIGVTSPALGQVLSMASTSAIRWNASPASTFNIILEQPGGAGAGFIVQNLSAANGNQYVWKVGTVFSSGTDTNMTVPPGTYRIRLESAAGGAAPTDEVSGWFTLVAPQFTVTSVSPSSAPADGATAAVLFGSGFTSYSFVYFDTDRSGIHAPNLYVSPDGTVLVFTVPTTVSAGTHTIFVDNGSNSPASIPFVVNAIQ